MLLKDMNKEDILKLPRGTKLRVINGIETSLKIGDIVTIDFVYIDGGKIVIQETGNGFFCWRFALHKPLPNNYKGEQKGWNLCVK